MPLSLFIIGGSVGLVILLALIAMNFYVVVEPNKAHVVVSMGGGRKIYHPARDNSSSAYFYIPFLMQRIIVSLENVKHEIKDIILKDMNVAPFMCDITCWFRIENPELAAEKLDVDEEGNIMRSITETLNAQIQGVARSAAMGQEVIELMRNRQGFGDDVFKQVNGDLDEWGVQLVKLEIIDFNDTSNSHVIRDYEARREAQVASETRKIVAAQDKAAKVVEAESTKVAEKARLDSEQAIEMRDIEKQEQVGMRKEAQRLKVAEQADKANAKEVAAARTKTVGEAEYLADAQVIQADGEQKSQAKLAEGTKAAKITIATGEAEAVRLDATAQAEATSKKGNAEADVIKAKGLSEAEALEKKAVAQGKFQNASKDVEFKKIEADVEKSKFASMAQAYANAKVQIISDKFDFMGFGAKEGLGLGMALNNLKDKSGVDVEQAVKNVAKVATETLAGKSK